MSRRFASMILLTLLLAAGRLSAATLLGEYRLEELQWTGAAAEVRDSSGSSRHGQAIGSPLPTPVDAAPARPGKPGTCAYGSFPGPAGNGGALSIGGLPVNTAPGAKTSVSFWMYWDGTNSVMPIGWNRHDLWLVNGHFGFNTGNSDVFGVASAGLPGLAGLANRWVHVVAEFTNGNVAANALYIDGVAQALTQRQSTPANASAVVSSTLRVGGWQTDSSYRFSGRIDEVKVYDGQLTPAEVATLFNERHTCAPRLVLEWQLDECALGTVPGEVLDASANGNNGTPEGAANTGAGRVCRGGMFNGVVPTRIKSVSSFADAISNDFTIAFWVNPSATHEIDSQSTSGNSGSSGQHYALYPARGANTWGGGNAGAGVSVGTNGVSVYEHFNNSYMPALLVWTGAVSGWTHVAVVYQARQPRLYINGSLVATGLTSTYANIHPGLRSAGGGPANEDGALGGGASGWFNGGVDEFRIYDGALDATQVASIATAPARSCASCATLAHYRLEETAWTGIAGQVEDSSGNFRHGQALGAPLPVPATVSPARAGSPGTCGYGDFTGGALTLPVAANTAAGAKTTVSFWMYWNGANSVMPIGWNRHDLWLVNGHFGFNTANSDVFGISSAGLANRWVHVSAVFTNGSVTANKLYIDGALQTLTQRQSTPAVSNALVNTNLRVSGWQADTGYRFRSRIDEVNVFDGEMTQSQVLLQYNAIHPCGAVIPGSFNAFDTVTPAGIAGVVHTKVAGQAFDLAIVALDMARTAVETAFVGDVKIELLDASNNSGVIDPNGCRASWAPLPGLAPPTLSFAIADSGRKNISLTENNAWRDVRVRMTYPAVGAPTAIGCSTDNFAIRPAVLGLAVRDQDWQTAGIARTLNNSGYPGGTVHKAGQPFSITVTGYNALSAVATNYAGTPAANLAGFVLPALGVCPTCILSAGTFSGSGGTVASNTATYSEIGVIQLQASDDSFAAVDAGDGSSVAERTAYSTISAVGRFVPDHFTLTSGSVTAACAAGAPPFTYMNQSFQNLGASIQAQNAAGAVTVNYHSAGFPANLATVVWQAENANNGFDLSNRLDVPAPSPLWGNGTYMVNTAAASLRRATPDDPDGPFDSLRLGVRLTDLDAVVLNGLDMDVATAGACSPCDAKSVGAATSTRFGRLHMLNAHGSELRALPLTVRNEFWNGTGFITNGADNCSTVGAVTLNAAPSACTLNPSLAGIGSLLLNGVATLTLGAPNVRGCADIIMTTPAWLLGRWDGVDQLGDGRVYDDNAAARATFGVYRERLIYRREVTR